LITRALGWARLIIEAMHFIVLFAKTCGPKNNFINDNLSVLKCLLVDKKT
jgi:hypothetical protein